MASLIEELKRRNVIRVGLAYVVLSWLLLQVGDVLFEALRLDDNAMTVLLAVLGLGFLPVLIFAWVYELTPEGVKRESDVDRSTSITSHTGQRLNVAIVVLLLAAIGLFAWDRFGPAAPVEAPAADSTARGEASEPDADDDTAPHGGTPSIAVLPFADLSAEGDQAYFADGVAEELLNVLARIDGLKVAARTSSFKFRGEEQDIAEIGQALNVSTVLEGSVRKAGDQVRITAQLIEAEGGFHLWSESYDRKLDNIFAVQDEIANAIVDALRLELALAPATDAAEATSSGEAYDLYLRGREFAREPSKEGLLKAIRYFEEALAVDPDFAPAWGAISSAWVWLEDYGGVPSTEAYARAERAATRALELAPGRADALTAMGFLQDRMYDAPVEAIRFFEQALAANPAHIETYTMYANALIDMGEIERAMEVRREAVLRDPLSTFIASRLAGTLMVIGRQVESQAMLDELLETAPEDTYVHEEQANLLWLRGELALAIREYQVVHDGRPGDPFSAAQIACIYQVMEMPDQVEAWIEAARARGASNRWELEARRCRAWNVGDWDELFRAGQLYLSQDGALWQGEASLAKGDWEAARAAFLRMLARLDYRDGEPLSGRHPEAMLGLALAEQRLGIETWERYADPVRTYLEEALANDSTLISGWPPVSIVLLMARLSALQGDAPGAVSYLQRALAENVLFHGALSLDPFFADLRDDPRVVAVAAEMRSRALIERERLTTEVDLP